MDLQTVKQKIKDIKTAIKFKAAEARRLKEVIAVEKIATPKNDRKIRSLTKELDQLKLEISKNLPEALESAEHELKIAEREEKEKAEFILKMEALIPEMRKKSKELLKKLQEVQPVNNELRQMISGYNMMQTKTEKGMDISGVSSGFQSLDSIIEVLEEEIAGVPRTKTMIFYPANFPL